MMQSSTEREDPIFITGVYRSGTTLISRVLGAHPELDITYDSVNYFRFILKKGIKASKYRDIVSSTVKRLQRRHEISLDSAGILEEVESATEITHKEIYRAIMKSFFGYTGKRWGEKSLLEWTNISTFLEMFPQGRAIHIIRDPRDVLISYKKMTIETGDKYLDSIFANMHSMDYALARQDTLPSDRYLLLRYEDYIADPRHHSGRICDFLGIEFVDGMLDESQYTNITGRLFDRNTHSSFPGDGGPPVDRWKSTLSRYEICLVEGLLRRQMEALAYELTTSPTDNPVMALFETLGSEPLLKSRMLNFLQTDEGAESYPSDPTESLNWGDTGVTGRGAAAAYGRRDHSGTSQGNS